MALIISRASFVPMEGVHGKAGGLKMPSYFCFDVVWLQELESYYLEFWVLQKLVGVVGIDVRTWIFRVSRERRMSKIIKAN
jgi:hypothetical protein